MSVALLASPSDFAAERGVAFDPTDTAAIIALEQASDLIRGLIDQELDGIVTDDEVVLDGTGTRSILLPQLPVLGVSTVSTVWDWDDTPVELVADEDYKVDLRRGILWRQRHATWTVGFQNIIVTYDHGYSLPGADPVTLPADLQGLCRTIAGRMMNSGESGGQTVRSEQIGTYRVSYDATAALNQLTTEDYAILSRYRRHGMA